MDPKSIFDELVDLFIAAKNKRQVIMVTHNANLVVNTDADQVIVAIAGTHTPGELPPMSYLSGGLEFAEMRKHVCDTPGAGRQVGGDKTQAMPAGTIETHCRMAVGCGCKRRCGGTSMGPYRIELFDPWSLRLSAALSNPRPNLHNLTL